MTISEKLNNWLERAISTDTTLSTPERSRRRFFETQLFRLEPSVKEAWLIALRSGDYLKGRGQLGRVDEDNPEKKRFCCLGVYACALNPALVEWDQDDLFYGDTRNSVSKAYLPPSYIPEAIQQELATLNDATEHGKLTNEFLDSFDFDDVATIIETYL